MVRGRPEDVKLAEIMAALYLRLKTDEGKGIPYEQVRARLQKWLT